ncbi:hypothetical protein EYF80_024185 [Liparis tanakae]|uniref:Uncharacterized protein n=1 Tax=Liparis tanakae TaxID=230148 RepID=A0A4Z2HIM2_9TELE|nr:hypothetical protein EYF80_024185 [Liparis tanakae]
MESTESQVVSSPPPHSFLMRKKERTPKGRSKALQVFEDGEAQDDDLKLKTGGRKMNQTPSAVTRTSLPWII